VEIDGSLAVPPEELFGTSVPYFGEIIPFRRLRPAESLFRIEQIVGVEGDTRRGRQPFPHPFPARMPMEVAEAAVSALTKPGEIVLDPMVGSGVVPRAAVNLGRRAVGIDIDPLAVILSRALCAHISVKQLESTAADSLREASEILRSGRQIKAQWGSLDDEDRKFIMYWFREEHAKELFALSLAIEKLAGSQDWSILATLFSSLIISRGSGASLAMDLSRSRPHRVDAKVARSPFSGWGQKVVAFRRYYENCSNCNGPDLKVGDARNLRIADESIDAVITSPPYINAIDYMRMSKFTLIFLGSRLRDLRTIRATSVGTEVGLAEGRLPMALESLVERSVADPKRWPMLRRYIYDLHSILDETFRVLKPGGQALYAMGPSILSRREYDAANVLSRMAASVGFRPIGHGRRDLSEARRSLPPPCRSKRSQSMNKRMTCEFYVALAKDSK
jgi:DNA modification methylase